MQLPLVIGIQQRTGGTIEFIAQEKSRLVAEGRAELEYIERRAHMACVLEIDKYMVKNTEKVSEIFKIERLCDCSTIQRQFNYIKGTSYLMCSKCLLNFGQEELINEQEQISLCVQGAGAEPNATEVRKEPAHQEELSSGIQETGLRTN